MNVSLQVLIASLLIGTILLAGYSVYVDRGHPSVNLNEGTEAIGSIDIPCTKTSFSAGGVTFDVLVSLNTILYLGVKNNLNKDITIDKIVPVTTNLGAGAIATHIHLAPGEYKQVRIQTNWLNLTGLVMRAVPGDVIKLTGGHLEKEASGAIALYSGGLPSNTPHSYKCPLPAQSILQPEVSGSEIRADIKKPACAPILVSSHYETSHMLILGNVNPKELEDSLYDVPLYIHIYKDDPQEPIGIYYRNASYGFGFLDKFVDNYFNDGADEYRPTYRHPAYFGLWVDGKRDTLKLYADDKVQPVKTENRPIPDTLKNVVVGIARVKPTAKAVYVAIALDSSGSMSDEWDSLVRAIRKGIPIFKEKNVKLALLDFTTPRKCWAGPYRAIYCSDGVRIWTDFTTDYNKVARICDNIRVEGWTEPDSDVVYIASTRLSWASGKEYPKVIILASDEENQEIDYSTSSAIREAKKRDIKIYVVHPDYSRCRSLDVYAKQTGGKVITRWDNFGEIVLDIIENIQLPPAYLISEVPILGVFKDRTLTIKGLYPGDRIVLTTVDKTVTINATHEVETIDLLKYFSVRDLVRTLQAGGVIVSVQPSTLHLLAMVPSQILIHVKSEGIDAWIKQNVILHPHCTLSAMVSKTARLMIVRNKDLFHVYIFPQGSAHPIYLGVYPKIMISGLYNYKFQICYGDGSCHAYKVGDYYEKGVVLKQNLRLIINSDELAFLYGNAVVHRDRREFTSITITTDYATLRLHFGK